MRTFIAIAVSVFIAAPAMAQDWGNFSARFLLEGQPPTPAKLDVNKDVEYCGKFGLVSEAITVGKGKELANIVVYLSPRPGTKPPIHTDYEAELKKEVLIDNSKCRFDKHVTVVRTGQKVVIGNSDPIGHNTKADFFNNPSFNDLIPAKSNITKVFEKQEATPVSLSCSIHPWMSAKLLILEHPYAAASSEDGKVEIKNLPAGKWTFTVWAESCGYVSKAKRGGKAVEWRRGKWDVEIKKGDNDQGDVLISLDTLTKKGK